jgi:predicted  nucleic acid-binding Zn-ribbon protein
LKKRRAVAEAELTQQVKDLAAAPLSVETAIATYENWRAKHEALEAKVTALEKLLSVINEHIKELKKEHPEIFMADNQRKLKQLKSEEKLRKAEIERLEGIAKEAGKVRTSDRRQEQERRKRSRGGQKQTGAPQASLKKLGKSA